LFSGHGLCGNQADILVYALPTPVLKALQIKVCALQAEHNKDMVSGLEKAGLKADSGAGVFIKYFLRGGGYYIDVGHSGIIASRQVTFSKVKEMKKSSRTACASSMARS
jgi:hypothetical protein